MSETNSTKKCSSCTYKPLSEFHKYARSKDGLQSCCKVCNIASTVAYKKTDAGKATAAKADAKYKKTGKRKAYLAKYKKTDAAKLSQSKATDKYKAANPIKDKAKRLLGHAIESGKVTKPLACSKCTITKRLDGHHDDYALPLVVRWLCRLCHTAWHAENGPGLNG